MAGKVDPVEDIDVINFELALADITQIEKRLERIAKGRAKTKEEIASNEVALSAGHKNLDLMSLAPPRCCHSVSYASHKTTIAQSNSACEPPYLLFCTPQGKAHIQAHMVC